MKERWEALAPRERRLIQLAATIIGIVLAWYLIYSPLANSRARLESTVIGLRQDLAQLRPQVDAILERRVTGQEQMAPRPGRSLLAMADSSARDAGLGGALKRVEPIGERSVRVWMDGADFDAMAAWLEKLAREEGVAIDEWSVDRALVPGVVNARMTLELRPG